jgi:hypothetical protein
MVERLNGIIDAGMQAMAERVQKEVEEVEEVKGEVEEVPKECLIFKKIDESQIAFERYLQKLMRKNQNDPEPTKLANVCINATLDMQKQS